MSSSTIDQSELSNKQSAEKLPITVLIPTLNAEGHLDELLDSIEPYVSDIFIVDSFSLDKTVDIALERKIKIVQRHYVNSSDQFRWMLKNLPVKTPWIFFMAQDERFSESLVDALRKLFEVGIPEDVAGCTVDWRLWFMGQPLHAKARNLRLLRTAKCDVSQVACNEHFLVTGAVRHVRGILEHKDTLNLHEWYEKQNLWTTREAIQQVEPLGEDERPKIFGSPLQRKAFFRKMLKMLPGRNAIRFLYYYLKFGAWKDGRAGFVWASLRVWVANVIDLKAIEMRHVGIPVKIPEGRHGVFDQRILDSELQRELLPESINAEIN